MPMHDQKHLAAYWTERGKTMKENAVGIAGTKAGIQDANYAIREAFIFESCPTGMTTLDYGCGIGRYAHRFKHYVGVDITAPLLQIAKRRHPGKRFEQLADADPAHTFTKLHHFKLFFTATVLQHCPEETVHKVFSALRQTDVTTLSLYENCSEARTGHVEGRPGSWYVDTLKKYLPVASIKSRVHKVNKEPHEHLIIKLQPRKAGK